MNPWRGWRPLLRLAWRDLARAKARSALVLFMIALPVLAVTAADVLYQTSEISGTEALDRRIGGADARITVDEWTTRVIQGPDPDHGAASSEGGEDGQVPSLADLSTALGRDLRGLTQVSGETRVETDKGVAAAEASEMDLGDPLASGLFRIDEGRAPAAPDEVVVNHDLAERGPGLGETLRVVDGASLRVVGVGDSTSYHGHPILVAPPGALGLSSPGSRTWYVDAGGPVTWADVLTLNGVGATVLSRAVLEDPPSASELPAELTQYDTGTDSSYLAVLVLIVVMVLLEVVLLAGPAFAVGARRQSRNLALMAATGGTPVQARRTILASGLVLGGLGAALGVVAGIGVAAAAMPVFQRFSDTYFGPFEVPWLHLVGIAGFGLLSALLAAVVPAWIASRQDVVAVLAGRRGDRKPGLRSPLLGALLLGGGVAGSAYGAKAQGNGEILIAFSAILAVLGMILLVPILLAGLSRLSGRLPLTLRFAVRDAARHRTRTVPAVAAVAATVAGVVALGIANASDAKENEATYLPTLREGDAVVSAYDATESDWPRIRAALAREVPDATVQEVQGVGEFGGSSTSLRFQAATRRQLLDGYGSAGGASVLVAATVPRFLPDLPDDAALAQADRRLASGGAVVFTSGPVSGDSVLVNGQTYDDSGEPTGRIRKREVPATFVRTDNPGAQAILSPELAAELGVESRVVGLALPGASLTQAEEEAATEAVGAIVPYSGLYVERGYHPDDATRILLLVLGALGGVLMLGGTLTATFLALADARPDLATLSAVGAAPRTRRGVAGSFAIVVALTGALVGAVVGFIPGVAVTYPLTSSGSTLVVEGSSGYVSDGTPATGPFLDIPWLLILSLVVALPLLTAAVVALSARSRLPLVARLD